MSQNSCSRNLDANERSARDPLYTKIELLPTDKALLVKQYHKAQNMLAPHFDVLRFLESHFNAIRMGNPQDQRLFCRFVDSTTSGLRKTNAHPLAREIHFRLVLLALRVLKHFYSQGSTASWKVKDQVLSAALAWFRHPPRYGVHYHWLAVSDDFTGGHSGVTGCKSKQRIECSVMLRSP